VAGRAATPCKNHAERTAVQVKAERIWLLPEVSDAGLHGGDDGTGGWAPLAVVLSGGSTINWVWGNHLGVPTLTSNSTDAVVTPTGYLMPGFPGQIRTFADLYYNKYRDYDPTLGRYVQMDPIGLDGGSNPYLYAGGNPLGSVDPEGLTAEGLVRGVLQSWKERLFPEKKYCPSTNVPVLSRESAGGSEKDRCGKVIRRCQRICSDRFADDPESLPGTGRDYAQRIRRCITECAAAYGCDKYY
jgi:RHS repeat-associated protein